MKTEPMKLRETIRMAATVRATIAGRNLVDAARCKKGWNKRDVAWADLATTSLSTLGRFWLGVPIRTETFKQICLAVGIAESDWEDLVSSEESEESDEQVSDEQGRKSHAVITLGVSLDDIPPEVWHLVSTSLAKYGMSVIDIAEGSIKLLLEGSLENIAVLNAMYQSGELSAILSMPIQSAQWLDSVELVEWIREHNGEGLYLREVNLREANLNRVNLRGADLRGSDLRGVQLRGSNLNSANLNSANLNSANLSAANLSGANLSEATLYGANLRGANVTATRFGEGIGLSDLAKVDLKSRGAIFDEGTRDREESLAPIPSGRR